MKSVRSASLGLLTALLTLAGPGAGCSGPATTTAGGGTAVAHKAATSSGGAPAGADPLQHVVKRYPAVHYLTARGKGANPDGARESARRLLLETIQSRLSAVQVEPPPCEGDGCSKKRAGVQRLVKVQTMPFKHGALIHMVDPVRGADGGYETLAYLRRDEAAPYIEKEVDSAREKLEAWRRQMREGIGAGDVARILALCGEDPSRSLQELEQLRLALAVLRSDADRYTPSDDLKSVLELQLRARKLLDGMKVDIVLAGDGGDEKIARKLAEAVKELVVKRGLPAQLHLNGAPGEQPGRIVLTLEPEIIWSEDSFHFLRTGLQLEGRFAGSPDAFLQLGVDANRTKAGGVKKAHAQRASLEQMNKILREELASKLPDASCRLSWDD